MEEIFIIEWAKVKTEVREMFESGRAVLCNGVARDSQNSSVIVQHMPFTKIGVAEAENLLETAKGIQSAQAVIIGAVTVSTVAIMGAIIASTAYLSNKLNKIQHQLDAIQREIEGQNILFYFERITNYFGAVEALREIIISKNLIEENRDLVLMKISELLTLRNQMILFSDNLINVSDNFTLEHKALAIDFINMTFDLIPKGVFIESQAAYKIERIHLGNNIRSTAEKKYFQVIENYRNWGNQKYRSIVEGKVDDSTKALQSRFQDIKTLISSEENKLLLEYST